MMEHRLSILVACVLLGCAGCTSTRFGKSASPAAAAAPAVARKAPPAVVDSSPKDDGKRAPRVAVAMAAYKEAEARQLDRNPETQFKVRDQARKLYQEAIGLDPTNLEAHRGLARVYVDLGDFARAQETLRKAQAKFPKESIFWYEHAQMHNRRHEFAEAVKILTKALDMDPENRTYMTTLGLTLARSGRTNDSVTVLTRSMGPASAHYNVARMLMHLQRPQEAVTHLHLALQHNSHLDAARNMLAQLETGQGVQPVASLELQATQ
jgi:tetratricopeptide (TPR) repeat protein